VLLLFGVEHVLSREALFFSQAALVTFGGAYAVLAYIREAAVGIYGWLRPQEMLDGLGLAESTPGPLILVTEFVGFLGAYHHPGGLPPLAAGALGAAVATWATFAPCFLWIFAGAPYIERLREMRPLGAALSAVTAAVVGVILDLGVSFAREALDPLVLTIAAVGFVGLWKGGWGMAPVILGSIGAGLLRLLPT
jgi:chromate transporter